MLPIELPVELAASVTKAVGGKFHAGCAFLAHTHRPKQDSWLLRAPHGYWTSLLLPGNVIWCKTRKEASDEGQEPEGYVRKSGARHVSSQAMVLKI